MDVQPPLQVCRCRKRCSSPLVKMRECCEKRLYGLFCLQVFIIRHPSGVHRAGCECPNVRSGAWEFPSTKALLPLFVSPQRTSGSITRDPDLTLSPVHPSRVPTSQNNHASSLLRSREISGPVCAPADLRACVHVCVSVCVCW